METPHWLDISLILRSGFSGGFFLISYYVASHSPLKLNEIDGKEILSTGVPVALIAGVVVYGLHRSLFYPFVEWFLDSNCGKAKRKCCSLISPNSVTMLLSRWQRGAEKPAAQRARHISIWADYAHHQYVSAHCIALGALTSIAVVPSWRPPCWALVGLMVVFYTAAFVSDWRLHSFQDHILGEEAHPIQQETEQSFLEPNKGS